MSWPPNEQRCLILSHLNQCHDMGQKIDVFEKYDDPDEHCQKCPHCLTRILRPIFLNHLEKCKIWAVLETL